MIWFLYIFKSCREKLQEKETAERNFHSNPNHKLLISAEHKY